VSLVLGFTAQPADMDISGAGTGPLLIGFLEVCVVAASRYSLMQKQRSDHLADHLKLAQYQALQTQLNPHFLFNTLNHISADVMDAPENAVFMLDELADLLRGILDHVTKTMVTLEQELVLLQHYLTLQENRFGDRLRVEITCTEESRRALIPPMMLQIFVENSITHGFSDLTGRGEIKVTATVSSGRLVLEVADNGTGYDSKKVPYGLGISMIADRLAMLFGEDHLLAIESSPGRGCRTRISIPAQNHAL